MAGLCCRGAFSLQRALPAAPSARSQLPVWVRLLPAGEGSHHPARLLPEVRDPALLPPARLLLLPDGHAGGQQIL